VCLSVFGMLGNCAFLTLLVADVVETEVCVELKLLLVCGSVYFWFHVVKWNVMLLSLCMRVTEV
jgi:hypothetical protein